MTTQDKRSPDNDKSLTKDAREAATKVSDAAKESAQNIAQTAASEAQSYAGQAKDAAAGEVKDVASALRTAADELRSGSPQERTFSQIADSLADASDALRSKDLGEMVGAVNDFARRNPMAFLGSAALIGFAATRFAKASGTGSEHAGHDASAAYRDRHPPQAPLPASSVHAPRTTAGPDHTTTSKGGTA